MSIWPRARKRSHLSDRSMWMAQSYLDIESVVCVDVENNQWEPLEFIRTDTIN